MDVQGESRKKRKKFQKQSIKGKKGTNGKPHGPLWGAYRSLRTPSDPAPPGYPARGWGECLVQGVSLEGGGGTAKPIGIHPSIMIRNLMIRNSGSHRPGFLQIFESLTPRDPDNQLPNGGGAQSYPRLIRRLYNFMYFWVPWALVYFGGLRN